MVRLMDGWMDGWMSSLSYRCIINEKLLPTMMSSTWVCGLRQMVDELWEGAGQALTDESVCVCVCVCVCVSTNFQVLNESVYRSCAFLIQVTPTATPPFWQLAIFCGPTKQLTKMTDLWSCWLQLKENPALNIPLR